MYIGLKPVDRFTNPNDQSASRAAFFSATPDITSMRHLRNKITAHTNPVVVIDHGQTAMLALLNGIRSTPTLPRPMPAGHINDIPGVSTWDGQGHDARKWGLPEPGMSLDSNDFSYETSQLVRIAREPWGEASVDHGAAFKSILEKCKEHQLKLMEDERQAMLDSLMKYKVRNTCYCQDSSCPVCDCYTLIGELTQCVPPEVEDDPICPVVEEECAEDPCAADESSSSGSDSAPKIRGISNHRANP
uniref:Uncharacterized protein n=1 Tax=uncultured Thiotrichaceae bacterium TaxID=298394 RepID=A0A6S6UEW6_9GAMM|nr:MAG: Unknown protein [uncultured Thiotrichaceae bacterium]